MKIVFHGENSVYEIDPKSRNYTSLATRVEFFQHLSRGSAVNVECLRGSTAIFKVKNLAWSREISIQGDGYYTTCAVVNQL